MVSSLLNPWIFASKSRRQIPGQTKTKKKTFTMQMLKILYINANVKDTLYLSHVQMDISN
jgi:hypothetical protein